MIWLHLMDAWEEAERFRPVYEGRLLLPDSPCLA